MDQRYGKKTTLAKIFDERMKFVDERTKIVDERLVN
jgi:hypothetical protein